MGKTRLERGKILSAAVVVSAVATAIVPNFVSAEEPPAAPSSQINTSGYSLLLSAPDGHAMAYEDFGLTDYSKDFNVGTKIEYSFDGRTGWTDLSDITKACIENPNQPSEPTSPNSSTGGTTGGSSDCSSSDVTYEYVIVPTASQTEVYIRVSQPNEGYITSNLGDASSGALTQVDYTKTYRINDLTAGYRIQYNIGPLTKTVLSQGAENAVENARIILDEESAFGFPKARLNIVGVQPDEQMLQGFQKAARDGEFLGFFDITLAGFAANADLDDMAASGTSVSELAEGKSVNVALKMKTGFLNKTGGKYVVFHSHNGGAPAPITATTFDSVNELLTFETSGFSIFAIAWYPDAVTVPVEPTEPSRPDRPDRPDRPPVPDTADNIVISIVTAGACLAIATVAMIYGIKLKKAAKAEAEASKKA